MLAWWIEVSDPVAALVCFVLFVGVVHLITKFLS